MKKGAQARTVAEYIELAAPEIRERLAKLRATIRAAAPDAEERIAYRIPTFSQRGNLVHFAAYAGHIGFYPGASGIKSFAKELAAYATSKGGVQLPHDRPLPHGVIRKIVRFRLAENLEKDAARAAKKATPRAASSGSRVTRKKGAKKTRDR
jgi:uncharacterized protein YdhG (YjbR/CyaY superfamily)